MEKPPVKLLDRIRYRIRVKGYSIRTEQSYVDWARRFILFHNKRHPQDMGKDEIEALLPISCRTDTIFVQFRNCWATKMSAQQ